MTSILCASVGMESGSSSHKRHTTRKNWTDFERSTLCLVWCTSTWLETSLEAVAEYLGMDPTVESDFRRIREFFYMRGKGREYRDAMLQTLRADPERAAQLAVQLRRDLNACKWTHNPKRHPVPVDAAHNEQAVLDVLHSWDGVAATSPASSVATSPGARAAAFLAHPLPLVRASILLPHARLADPSATCMCASGGIAAFPLTVSPSAQMASAGPVFKPLVNSAECTNVIAVPLPAGLAAACLTSDPDSGVSPAGGPVSAPQDVPFAAGVSPDMAAGCVSAGAFSPSDPHLELCPEAAAEPSADPCACDTWGGTGPAPLAPVITEPLAVADPSAVEDPFLSCDIGCGAAPSTAAVPFAAVGAGPYDEVPALGGGLSGDCIFAAAGQFADTAAGYGAADMCATPAAGVGAGSLLDAEMSGGDPSFF